jgi:hypothetical protein
MDFDKQICTTSSQHSDFCHKKGAAGLLPFFSPYDNDNPRGLSVPIWRYGVGVLVGVREFRTSVYGVDGIVLHDDERFTKSLNVLGF